jgi:hypothetical protein
MVPYRNLEEVRLSYGVDDQDPYFLFKKNYHLAQSYTRMQNIGYSGIFRYFKA